MLHEEVTLALAEGLCGSCKTRSRKTHNIPKKAMKLCNKIPVLLLFVLLALPSFNSQVLSQTPSCFRAAIESVGASEGVCGVEGVEFGTPQKLQQHTHHQAQSPPTTATTTPTSFSLPPIPRTFLNNPELHDQLLRGFGKIPKQVQQALNEAMIGIRRKGLDMFRGGPSGRRLSQQSDSASPSDHTD